MGFVKDYQPDYSFAASNLTPGECAAVIVEARETVSKNDKRMIQIKLKIQNRSFFLNIVEGAWFDSFMTEVFECFGIPAGNFNYPKWWGKEGLVYIDKDPENPPYYKITRLITPEKAAAETKPQSRNAAGKNAGAQPPGKKRAETTDGPLY